MTVRIGYLGPEGTFTAEAAGIYAAKSGLADVELVAFRTIADVLLGVQAGAADVGVVPAENSIEGSVAITLDYLVHIVKLTIMGEVIIPVRHNLLTFPGTELSQVETVLSHPQALAQCRHHLQALLPRVAQRSCNSTAEAAKLVSESGDPQLAALGTELSARLYNLQVAASDMQDTDTNSTRFLVVGHQAPAYTGKDKTSLVFAFAQDQPGNLFRALRAFADRGINLSKLESRPAKRSLGDYLFFTDLEGHPSEPLVASALDELHSHCAFVRVLGAYPKA